MQRKRAHSLLCVIFYFKIVLSSVRVTHTLIVVVVGGFSFHISFFILDNESIKRDLSLHRQLFGNNFQFVVRRGVECESIYCCNIFKWKA